MLKKISVDLKSFCMFQTSVFTPPYGTPTSVRVTSLIPTPDVIKLMLDKFRVVNNPDEFSLYCVKDNGGKFYVDMYTVMNNYK